MEKLTLDNIERMALEACRRIQKGEIKVVNVSPVAITDFQRVTIDPLNGERWTGE